MRASTRPDASAESRCFALARAAARLPASAVEDRPPRRRATRRRGAARERARKERASRAKACRGCRPSHSRAPREEVPGHLAAHDRRRLGGRARRGDHHHHARAPGSNARAVVIDWSLVESAEYEELYAIEQDVRSIGPAPYFAATNRAPDGEKEVHLEDADALWDYIDTRGRKGWHHPALQGARRDERRAALGDDAQPRRTRHAASPPRRRRADRPDLHHSHGRSGRAAPRSSSRTTR